MAEGKTLKLIQKDFWLQISNKVKQKPLSFYLCKVSYCIIYMKRNDGIIWRIVGKAFVRDIYTKLSKYFNVFWFLLLEWHCFAISLPMVIKACSISNIWFMSAFTINFCFYDNIVFCGFGVISKRQQLFNSQRLFINFLLDSLKIGQCWVVFNIINYTVDSTEPKRKN